MVSAGKAGKQSLENPQAAGSRLLSPKIPSPSTKVTNMKNLIFLLATIFIISSGSHAGTQPAVYDNAKALKGLTATKAYFDVTLGEPKPLLLRLQIIEKTYNQLVAAGVSPTFVVGIRDKASMFFTKGDEYVLDIDRPEKAQIAILVKKFNALDIGIEQCGIAAGFEEIDVADFLPEVELVANGYVSMIGYQTQGFALVSIN
jgi:hypothetical protein